MILEEFADIVYEEILFGLPPMRDIQHQIDLILGLALPNKPTFRMSLKENEELKKQEQVDDLFDKGCIQESKSPWAIIL